MRSSKLGLPSPRKSNMMFDQNEKNFNDLRNTTVDTSTNIVDSITNKTKCLYKIADNLIVYDPLDRPFYTTKQKTISQATKHQSFI